MQPEYIKPWYYKDGGGKVAKKVSNRHFDVEKRGLRECKFGLTFFYT